MADRASRSGRGQAARGGTPANASLRDESLNARNAFSNERPSGQTRQYAWRANGPLVKDKTGLLLSIDRSETFEQQVVRAAVPGGLFSALVPQPTNRLGLSVRLDQALGPGQEITVDVRARAAMRQTSASVSSTFPSGRTHSVSRTSSCALAITPPSDAAT